MANFRKLLRLGEPFSTWARRTVGSVALAVFTAGLWWHVAALVGVGSVVLVALVWAEWAIAEDARESQSYLKRKDAPPRLRTDPQERARPLPKHVPGHPEYGELPASADTLVDEMLNNGRYALLLRPEMNRHL